jgi:hypothetical protein
MDIPIISTDSGEGTYPKRQVKEHDNLTRRGREGINDQHSSPSKKSPSIFFVKIFNFFGPSRGNTNFVEF